MKKFSLVLFILVVVGGFYFVYGNQPAALPAGSKSAQVLQAGTYEVHKMSATLTDNSRVTEANGDYEGADSRSFKVDVYSPASKPTSAQPLLIYSHGFMSSSRGGKYLSEYFASHGYTVVVPTYPLTNLRAPGGPNPQDVVNQPGDISFIIDHFLQHNQDASNRFYQRIDPSRIAVAGLSLGGLTSTLAAYHPTFSDDRIAAAVSIAGPSHVLTKTFFDHRSLPFMMVATPQDAVVSFAANAADIPERVAGAVLVTIDDASHVGFADTGKWFRWFDNPDSLACRQLMNNPNVGADKAFDERMGTPEIGVVPSPMKALCTMNPMPSAMNPLRQHQLSTLAVAGFLNCHFAPEESDRRASCKYLMVDFPSEFSEVEVR